MIAVVFRRGDFSEEGRQAVKELGPISAPVVPELVAALRNPPHSDLHPRDLWDSINGLFSELARTGSDALLDAVEQGRLDPSCVCSALRYAKGERSLDALIAGLRHMSQHVRWMAADALVRRRSRRAAPEVIAALRDRSHMVKLAVVSAMKSSRMYRRPEALPLLRRIVDSKSVRQQSPGLWKSAAEVLEQVRREQGSASC